MDNTRTQSTSKTVFIIGDLSLESVEDKIAALGYIFQIRSIGSQPSDFKQVVSDLKQLASSGELLAVLLFLTVNVLINCSTSEYLELWNNVLSEMNGTASLFFIDKNCLQNKYWMDHNDEITTLCLSYIENTTKILDEHYLNGEFIDLNGLRNRLLLVGNLSISSENGIYTIDFMGENEKQAYFVRPTDKDHFPIEVLIQIELLIDSIVLLRKSIFDSLDYVDILMLYQSKNELETTMLVFKRLQRDFIAKQTVQLNRTNHLLHVIRNSGVTIVPYKERKEISIRVHHFLDEVDKGVLLHLYVPHGQYQEDQLASFLRLFENYLQRVEQLQFSVESRRTLHGTVYEFKSKSNGLQLADMEVAFSRFESFMSLCQNDRKKAEIFLLSKGLKQAEANQLMKKYIVQYQQLQFDMKQELDRKVFELGQTLERETFVLTHDIGFTAQHPMETSALLSFPGNLNPLGVTIYNSSVNLNSGIQSFIEQEMLGDIHYTTEDKQLLTLFDKYAAMQLETVGLRSELQQLKDISSPEVKRKTAKQKITDFLYKVAPTIGQSALTVLTAYLEKLLTGS